jgi:opacity protein-like surface antigen
MISDCRVLFEYMSDKMPFTMARRLAVVASLVFLFGGSVVSAAESGWYIGAGVGESKIYDTSACSKVGGALEPGFSCRERTTDTAKRIFGGYRFNQYVSVETSYIDIGNFSASASGTKSGVPATGSISLKASGITVDVDGVLPITEPFGLLGQIGIVRWRTTKSSSISTLGVSMTEDESTTGVSLQIGAGVKYDFTRDIRGRVELVRYPDTNGRSQIDVLLVSVAYRFE